MSNTPQFRDRASWSYSGEVWTDEDGLGVVLLPPFVRAHREGFDYELTPTDAHCSARVVEEVANDQFTIATDAPHVKVVWRVTALRAGESAAESVSPSGSAPYTDTRSLPKEANDEADGLQA